MKWMNRTIAVIGLAGSAVGWTGCCLGRASTTSGLQRGMMSMAKNSDPTNLLLLHASKGANDTNNDTRKSSGTSLASSSSLSGVFVDADLTATSPQPMWGHALGEETKEWNRDLVHNLKSLLFDTLFAGKSVGRAYARFYALETIARMPYFSYLSVLHLFETLGMWRRANYLKVHFAESWNELHHLLIMEELGGNERWIDRWVAQHIAFGYYWMVVGLYIFNPTHAYHLNQMVEEEAYGTYDRFIAENKEYLRNQPAPKVAVSYYTGEDLYLFDAMHHGTQSPQGIVTSEPRRPACETLFDCFINIRDDEQEHVKTMAYFQKGAE